MPMGTPAALGLLDDKGGGAETLVGYDGHPESLGTRLRDLAVEKRGDLLALCTFVSSAQDGWRFAFRESYEGGFWAESIPTRPGQPLLRHDDAIVTGRGADGVIPG
jgi:hypothetical protein